MKWMKGELQSHWLNSIRIYAYLVIWYFALLEYIDVLKSYKFFRFCNVANENRFLGHISYTFYWSNNVFGRSQIIILLNVIMCWAMILITPSSTYKYLPSCQPICVFLHNKDIRFHICNIRKMWVSLLALYQIGFLYPCILFNN